MVAIAGTYQNGEIKPDKEYSSETAVKVIVTFLEDAKEPVEKRLTLADRACQ